jgi:replicative DNA helicase
MNANDDEFFDRLHPACAFVYRHDKTDFIVNDSAGLSAEEVVANIRDAKKRLGRLDFFVLDHFHLLRIDGNKFGEDDRALKLMRDACKKLGCVGVILSQFNRNVERDHGREPRMADLKNCTALEEIATSILLLHWEYKRSNTESHKSVFKMICEKQRRRHWPHVLQHISGHLHDRRAD